MFGYLLLKQLQVVIIEKDGDKGIGSLGLSDYFIELEDENVSGGKRKHGKRKQRKKSKGKKKLKKFMPIFLGLGGLKLLMYHFFIKKMAFFSFLSFILSKISFVLATLVALKHFFHTPQHQERTEKNKIEVVHIPFSKFRQGDRDIENDNYYEESQFIPVTFEAEPNVESTTSFNIDLPYNGRYRENSFISSEERYNENSQNQFAEDIFNRADKRSRHNLMNHVHSPFA